MGAPTSLFFWQEQLGTSQPRTIKLEYKITAAKTASPIVSPIPALLTFDAATQAQLDAYSCVAGEFAAAAFDSTAMGTDAVGGVIQMGGSQATSGQTLKMVSGMASCYDAAGALVASARVQVSTALTASTLSSQVALGSAGDMAYRFVLTGLDALTSGLIVIELDWISK